MDKLESCAICAWRQSCQKKFSLSGRLMHCPEFARDVTIKEESSTDTAIPSATNEEKEGTSSEKVKPKKPEDDKE